MSAVPRTNDATMDDIMASIRRIVADEKPASKPSPVNFSNQPISAANDFRAPLQANTGQNQSLQTHKSHVFDLTDQIQPINASESTLALDPRGRVADIEFGQQVQSAETLLSNKTNAAVMASFDQLAQSFSRSSNLMDEMVREMLKPMLKQWLDENLPPIVEKLIRQEIERVARGGKA